MGTRSCYFVTQVMGEASLAQGLISRLGSVPSLALTNISLGTRYSRFILAYTTIQLYTISCILCCT